MSRSSLPPVHDKPKENTDTDCTNANGGTDRNSGSTDRNSGGTDRNSGGLGRIACEMSTTAGDNRNGGFTDKTAAVTNRSAAVMESTAVVMGRTHGSMDTVSVCRDRTAVGIERPFPTMTSPYRHCDSCPEAVGVDTTTGSLQGIADECAVKMLVGADDSLEEPASENLLGKGDSFEMAAASLRSGADSLERQANSWSEPDSQTVPLLRPNRAAANLTMTAGQLGQQQLQDWSSVSSLPNCEAQNGSCQKAQLISDDSSSDIILV